MKGGKRNAGLSAFHNEEGMLKALWRFPEGNWPRTGKVKPLGPKGQGPLQIPIGQIPLRLLVRFLLEYLQQTALLAAKDLVGLSGCRLHTWGNEKEKLHKSQFHRLWQSCLLGGEVESIQENAEKVVALFRNLLHVICPVQTSAKYIAKDLQDFAAKYTMGNHIEGGHADEKRKALLKVVGQSQSESTVPHTDIQNSLRVLALALIKGVLREELDVPLQAVREQGSPKPEESNDTCLKAIGTDDHPSPQKQNITKTTDIEGWLAGVQDRLTFPTDREDPKGFVMKLHGDQRNLRCITIRPTVEGLSSFLRRNELRFRV